MKGIADNLETRHNTFQDLEYSRVILIVSEDKGRRLPNVVSYKSAGSLARVPAWPQAHWAAAPMNK